MSSNLLPGPVCLLSPATNTLLLLAFLNKKVHSHVSEGNAQFGIYGSVVLLYCWHVEFKKKILFLKRLHLFLF